MWGAPEEPPDEMEGPGPSESHVSDTPVGMKEICKDNKSQLETFKDIMLKNKSNLKKKEEELQEYASKLSEIKSRAKRSRRSKDATSPSTETTSRSGAEGGPPEVDEDVVDDISQAKTPKAKSSLLQRKLAENRKIFERRSKEMTESKRAVEEKVEAIRQQMDQTDLTMVEAQKDPLVVTPVTPVLVTSQIISPSILYVGQDKDNKIAELSNRILELEASLIDLQDNLREKDSVIDSKTKAVTLMSADLSKKGKTTLDTLEDTKDEMRMMQENFVLLETSLRGKNDNLLEQLHERNERVAELEETINKYDQEMQERRAAETASASLSRSTMDTLADTKDAMRSMQENFVLIETSLKDKIENLLGQLEDRETKLAEAVEKIYKLESGAGIVSPPEIPDLQYKIDRLEQSNRALQDEKYELQKSIAALQEKIVARESSNGNDLIIEKDNRIAELENLIEELKSSNQLLEEESKTELQKQVSDLATKNEEFSSKIDELERLNNDLEIERNELRAKLPNESGTSKEDAMVRKLTKELDDLNKNMIKLKAQHKAKLRNLQKQLESFKMVSDANAELVKLGNHVALLEEEKGNLQLSLVDFDELKASAGDWQDRIADLESRVSTQTNDIQSHIEAIAILENQKLDLMQELHTVKQEISALEGENAELENLRVTAEMKVVDLEEQLESLNRTRGVIESSTPIDESEREELLRRIEHLTSENSELTQKLGKLEEKPSSEAGSTESFETIHEDKNEMLKKIESLSSRNNELEEKLSKLEEAARSNVGSTESFETINDVDRTELVKKIDSLSRENSDLVAKLIKYEEKGSSDTGSTESFEKIPERSENSSRIEFLTRENNELVIKLTKLEEKIENLDVRPSPTDERPSEEHCELERKLQSLISENNDLVIELTKAQEKLGRVTEEKGLLEKRLEDSRIASNLEIARQDELRSRLEALTTENNDLVIKLVKLEENNVQLRESMQKFSESEADCQRMRIEDSEVQSSTIVTVASLESEIEQCRKLIAEQTDSIDEMKTKLSEKEAELATRVERINEYEASSVSVDELRRELKESFSVIDEWKFKCAEMERKMEILEAGKNSIEEGLEVLQEENRRLVEQSRQKDEAASALKKELDGTISTFENQLETERALMAQQEAEINSLREILKSKDEELHDKYSMLQNEMIKIDSLQEELNDCRTQLRQSEATIVSLNEEILKLNDLAESSKEEVAVLREELLTKADKEARNEELSRTLSDKESLVEELRTMLNEQLKENAEIQNTTDNLEAETTKLRALLVEKENEVSSIVEAKTLVEENLRESTIARADAEVRLDSLQSNFDENSRYADGLRAELSDAYRMLELLKAKHTEDIEMQNRRLEDLIEDLNIKSSELETLRSELILKNSTIEELKEKTSELELLRTELSEKVNSIRQLEVRTSEFEKLKAEKEKLVGQNVTEQVKIALEQRVSELELKLEESSANTQAQLQKRKILAANLKKKSSEAAELEIKTVQLALRLEELEPRLAEFETRISHLEPKCLEAEARASSLEEKWTHEKSDKESANLRIQEIESIIQNRDSAILQLEAQLQRSRDETIGAMSRVDALSSELESSSEKMNVLTEQVAEMGEEIEKLRTALDIGSLELENVKLERERLIAEGESNRLRISQEENQRQQVLDEAKENARELGVRMQVMEAEYVEQLNTIQTLKTENGMLLSKQAQINERLENSEKKAADQRVLLEQFERERAARVTETQGETPSGTSVEEVPDVDGKASSSQPCDQCGQCETVVQALEAKLQERDAEIENLDNELANSIGNFVHMRESLRVNDLMMQSGTRNRSLEESRENSDLVFQYNSLTASNAEMRDQLNSTIQENSELREKIASLQALNAALQERTDAVQGELIEGREATTRLQAIDAVRSELLERCESRERELSGARSELDVMKQRQDEWMDIMRSRVEELEVENVGLTKRCDELVEARNVAESEIGSLRTEVDDCSRKITELEKEVEEHKVENARLKGESSRQVEAASVIEKRDDDPQLFDAARLFGSPTSGLDEQKELDALRKRLTEKDQEIHRLNEAFSSATKTADHNSIRLETAEADRCRLMDELVLLGQTLNERNQQVDALSAELNNVGARLSVQFHHRQASDDELESTVERMKLEREELTIRLKEVEASMENLKAINSNLEQDLKTFKTFREEEGIVDNAETESARRQGEPSDVAEVGWELEEGWDDEVRPKVDEDIWSCNPYEADGKLMAAPLIPNVKIALEARIAELEDTIKDLELERERLADEARNSQLRSGKLLQKLKEFKIQNESLQQQLKIQIASGGFCNLDSAIEEELKSQISNLERSLSESRDEQKRTLSERESQSKRIEVLSAANERLVEMKERQDMEVEVLQIRARDLASKLEVLEQRYRQACGDEAEIPATLEGRSVASLQSSPSEAPGGTECLCKKYREEIDELRDEMEALAAENEQLQKLLEEQRSTRLTTESRLSAEVEERARVLENSRLRIEELERNLQDSKNNCDSLTNECETLARTNAEQQASVKQSHEALKLEIAEKTSVFEAEVRKMSDQIDSAAREISALQDHLQVLMGEKEESGEKLSAMTEAMAEVTDLLNARVQEVAELRQEIQKLKIDKNEALEIVEGLAQNHSQELGEKRLEAELYVRQCEAQLLEKNVTLKQLADKLTEAEAERETNVVHVRNLREEIERLNGALAESKSHRESLQSELASKEQELFGHEEQTRNCAAEIERLNEVVSQIQRSSAETIEEANRKIREIEEREGNLKRTISELNFRESETLAQVYREIGEKDGQVVALQQTIANLEQKIVEVAKGGRGRDKTVEVGNAEDLPLCKMPDNDRELRSTMDSLRAELARKEEEIEDYKYQLSESTYPSIIQALQDQVNMLYEEKAQLEESLAAMTANFTNERRRKDELEELLRQQSQQQRELESQVDELASIVEGGENKDMEIRRLNGGIEKCEAEVEAMRVELASREAEIAVLRRKLDSTSEECELLKRVSKTIVQSDEVEDLRRNLASAAASSASDEAKMEQSSNELDLALYMLHQRDVRCEELTHELMQLLEERDTLQLRLSNAIRVNEELRRSLPADAHPSTESFQEIAEPEPMVEQPSPSRSVGPVEIAKEAIDSPSGEKVALAEKLSQLHNMGHRRDVRLMDDRDMRHNQQMSLLAHRDVLSTLPPEAAARIVNANYTLSRDVQSQSSVLMNWLWGKSTPKVVHM